MRELDEIKREHREILNLFLSVIILGLLLNCIVSALYVVWENAFRHYISLAVPLLLAATAVAAWVTIKVAILAPLHIRDEFATVLVFDVGNDEVSIPLVMSVTRERPLVRLGVPFPILARGVYRRLKNSQLYATIQEADEGFRAILVQQLMQFVILQWYRWHHMNHWIVGREYRRIGPLMRFGWFLEKPSETIPVSQLAQRWGDSNPFIGLQYSGKDGQLVLPKGITLTLEGPGDKDGRHKIVLAGKMLDLTIRVGCAGGVGGVENLRTWNRRLTGEPESLFAYSIIVEYDAVFHEGLYRYMPQEVWDWPPFRRAKPEVTIDDLYSWARGVAEGLQDYLYWYQEESEYTDSDIMELDRETAEGRVVYKPREPYMGAKSIQF